MVRYTNWYGHVEVWQCFFSSDQWPWILINQWGKGENRHKTYQDTHLTKQAQKPWQETNLMIIAGLSKNHRTAIPVDQLGLCNWQGFKWGGAQIWGNGDSVEMHTPMGNMHRGTKRAEIEKFVCKTGPVSEFVWLSLPPHHQSVLSTYIFLINIFLSTSLPLHMRICAARTKWQPLVWRVYVWMEIGSRYWNGTGLCDASYWLGSTGDNCLCLPQTWCTWFFCGFLLTN